jgi:hypothetical protein
MKKIAMKILFVFALVLSSFEMKAQEQDVLFIGNSLTGYNDMPEMLQNMVKDRKLPIRIASLTPGGWSLADQATKLKSDKNPIRASPSTATEKILSTKPDIVVLQEAPVQMLIPEKLRYCTGPALKFMDSVIKSVNARTILYQNFALNDYPQKYCVPNGPGNVLFRAMAFDPRQHFELTGTSCCSDSFQNRQQEFDVLKSECNRLAEGVHATVAEVGAYFELCRKTYPEIELYVSGDNHPSPDGSYLIACVFFKCITREKLSDLHYSADIASGTAKKLRALVDGGL